MVDFTVPDGVVNLDMFGCQCFECERCGTKVYTSGDISDMVEIEEGKELDDLGYDYESIEKDLCEATKSIKENVNDMC